MAIQVEWDNAEHTILRLIFTNPWTWDEFYEMRSQVTALCSGINYPVDAVVDMSKGRALPPNALTHLSKGAAKIPPNQGIIVGIGGDAFIRSMADMALAQAPHLAGKLQMVKNWDEAYSAIAQAQAAREGTNKP
jgi:hypothetical protein